MSSSPTCSSSSSESSSYFSTPNFDQHDTSPIVHTDTTTANVVLTDDNVLHLSLSPPVMPSHPM